MAGEKFHISKLFLGEQFASGGHSQIRRGRYDGEGVAVKIIHVPDLDDPEEKLFKTEVALLSHLNHQNIVKFVGAYENYPNYCILIEYFPGGSLRSYLNNVEKEPLPLRRIVEMALDIGRGMEYLHSQGIVHRDLKPENVLIDQDYRLKIADIGASCKEAKCEEFKDGRVGTYRWMAPEAFKRKSFNRKSDVYSFGLMMWEMVFGDLPFGHMAPIQAAEAAASYINARPDIPNDFPPAIGELIQLCWSRQPKKRPDFWQIVVALERLQDGLMSRRTDLSRYSIGGNQEDHHDKHKHHMFGGLQHWLKSHKPRFGLTRG